MDCFFVTATTNVKFSYKIFIFQILVDKIITSDWLQPTFLPSFTLFSPHADKKSVNKARKYSILKIRSADMSSPFSPVLLSSDRTCEFLGFTLSKKTDFKQGFLSCFGLGNQKDESGLCTMNSCFKTCTQS